MLYEYQIGPSRDRPHTRYVAAFWLEVQFLSMAPGLGQITLCARADDLAGDSAGSSARKDNTADLLLPRAVL